MTHMQENIDLVKHWLKSELIGIAIPDHTPSILATIFNKEDLEFFSNKKDYITFDNETIEKNGGYYKTLNSSNLDFLQKKYLSSYLNGLVR